MLFNQKVYETIKREDCEVNSNAMRAFEKCEWYRDCLSYFNGIEDESLRDNVETLIDKTNMLILLYDGIVYALDLINLNLITSDNGVLKRMIFDYGEFDYPVLRVSVFCCIIEEAFLNEKNPPVFFGI